jgi:2-polyprenyl-6-methoxyphenol hydroxylase-like FAD-dependent oxidoreductase
MHILIIGAGPAGLAMGQALRKDAIPFTIFERKPSLGAGSMGYRLVVRPHGVEALQRSIAADTWALIQRFAPRHNVAHVMDLTTGEDKGPMEPDRPDAYLRQDRQMLREILFHGLEDMVRFGQGLERYEIMPDGDGVRVHFSDGSSTTGTHLISADGTFSRVRQQLLPEFPLADSGAEGVVGRTPLDAALEKELAELSPLIHSHLVIGKSETLSIVGDPMRYEDKEGESYGLKAPQNYFYWAAIGRADNVGYAQAGAAARKNPLWASERIGQIVPETWHPALRRMIEKRTPESVEAYTMFAAKLPIPLWTSGLVTVMGDAIYPTRGSGLGVAFRDVEQIALSLRETGGFAQYEERMRVYAPEDMAHSAGQSERVLSTRPMKDWRLVR